MIQFQSLNYRKLQKQILIFLVAPLLGCYLSIVGENFFSLGRTDGMVLAQSLRVNDVAGEIYIKMSNLPQENQYINQETGKVDSDNTLMSRFLRYHQYVKGRSTQFRFDWKLTLADYLDVNERIDPERYPGYRQLTENPIEGDKKAIDSLTRSQRNDLVDLLVNIYKTESSKPSKPNTPATTPQRPQNSPNNANPSLPQPGDADLLKF